MERGQSRPLSIVAWLLLAAVASCSSDDGGDFEGTCGAGERCVCQGSGNCVYRCPEGGCHFRCPEGTECLFECAGGGCEATCGNAGLCIMQCPGDDCEIDCEGKGNCYLNDCQAGCSDGGRDDARGEDAGRPDGPPADATPPRDGTPPPDVAAKDAQPPDGCVPASCPALGKNCGEHDDGCGGKASCGVCAVGTCGGAGTPGVCGCALSEVTTPSSASAGKSLSAAGKVPWSNPTQITLLDAGAGTNPSGVAQAALTASQSPTHYLVASGFGQLVPKGAVVNGIEVELRRRARTGGRLADHVITLMTGPILLKANRKKAGTWPNSWGSYVSYGGPSDLWGRVWAPADINHSSFGVAIAVGWAGSSGDDVAFVDHVRLRVHYSTTCDCTPLTCGTAGYSCGDQADGCGGMISCGSCSAGSCVDGKCCVAKTCAGLGFSCGTHDDGCGGTVSCGGCSAGICAGGTCCLPKSCADLGFGCGTHDDGCGGTVSCGTCAPGDSCALGVCGCDDGVKGASEASVDCGGVCPAKCLQGAGCTSSSDCATNTCADGVCCDSSCLGPCKSCLLANTGAPNGTCAAVSDGGDPDGDCAVSAPATCGTTGVCAGGACQLHVAGTVCVPASCSGSLAQLDDTCDGAGLCSDGGSQSCGAAYVCADGAACESCGDGVKNGDETDVDCGGGAACSACGQGKLCGQPSDCGTGFCVDGVCCADGCAGFCMRCDIAGSVGTCANLELADPDNECPQIKKTCSGGVCVNQP